MKEEEQKDGVKTEEVPGRKDGSQRYSVEQKLRAVRLYLEEGYPLDLVQRETKVSISSLWLWVRRYRKEGEAGLRRSGREDCGADPKGSCLTVYLGDTSEQFHVPRPIRRGRTLHLALGRSWPVRQPIVLRTGG
jgi:transposase-like protein